MKNIIILLSFIFILSGQALANTTWEVAPGPSSIKFKVPHMIFASVEGKFKRIQGKVVSANNSLENAQMEARIPIASIYTGINDRDNHLRGKDFFYSEEFPEIIFKSNSVKKTGDHTYLIHGDLTMRGVTKSISLKANCEHERLLRNGKVRMDLIAKGQLSRYDFGLKWNQMVEAGTALVGEYVDIDLKLALMKPGPESLLSFNQP